MAIFCSWSETKCFSIVPKTGKAWNRPHITKVPGRLTFHSIVTMQIKCTGSEYWISTEKYLLGSPCFVNLQFSNSQLNSFRYARLWAAEVQVYDRFLLLRYLLAEGLYVMLAESGSNYSVMIKSEDRDVCLYCTLFSWHIWIFFIRIFRLKLPQLYLRLVIILYVDSESRE